MGRFHMFTASRVSVITSQITQAYFTHTPQRVNPSPARAEPNKGLFQIRTNGNSSPLDLCAKCC